jgi:hypothetical protein
MDLKEKLQFNSYEILQHAGVLAKEFTLSTPNLNTGYKAGDRIPVNILGVDEIVHVVGIQQQASDTGWATEIKGFGTGYELMSKAPKKTRSYLSMTTEEYDEFMWEFGGSLGKTIDYLEYVPLIRTGDDFGNGAWTATAIMENIVNLLGLTLVTNIIDYDVRQFSIQAGTPFIDGIVDLIKIYEPIIYEVEGMLFILEGLGTETAYIGGTYNPVECSVTNQEIIDAVPPEQLAVNGVLGQFFPDKYRGYAENTDLYSDEYGFTIRGYATLSGVPRIDSGEMTGPLGGFIYERRIARDPHGNDYFQYYEMRYMQEQKWFQEGDYVEGLGTIGNSGYYSLWTTLDEQFDLYHKTIWRYAHPVEDGQKKIVSSMVWRPRDANEACWIDGPMYSWEWMIEQHEITYTYSSSGQQEALSTIKQLLYLTDFTKDCFKPYLSLTREDSEQYILGEDVWQYWAMQEWTNRIQVPLSRESYALVTIGQRLNGLREDEVTGDIYLDYQAITPSIEIVQAGGHQGSAVEFRKMNTYAANGLSEAGNPDERDAVMYSHAESLSINCCNWDHLAQILELTTAYRDKKKVIRQYQMPVQYPLTVGLPVEFNDIAVGIDGQKISVAGASVGIITGYRISKQANTPSAFVEFSVKGNIEDE